ncbi:MAG: Hsp20/alpha crystallin family protein [bacterium]|nr:Hsp20/alpha crystallin family protein [bacterium]
MEVLRGEVARELAALEERMERALERVFEPGVRLPASGDSFRPAIDVFEIEGATVVRVELAGVRSEDVRLTVDGEYLQISGRRVAEGGSTPVRHVQMEIPQGYFERVLRLRTPYDSQRVVAKFDAGLLTVELPRRQSEPHKIKVEPG